ncbi:uncharacterized protein [Triticum aestivum]|uniref:uncharacterized protein isoform X2 n=1 Tax=Triticum aestivum TaxID=4565 RepID=UPI001D00DF0E|nr:uncharacterized protein LOC123098266 isoform X2 [Triticum aestivum]XP_044376153.1 uncharacterized protein LOC123098266 isoform X2 [Triticum aestivum]XP_044376154.1 uncharacterized protein LOC123098266 isoform X2 [Triticum aestivum]
MCYTSPPRLLGRFAASGVRARRRDGARRNSDVVPRWLDGVQVQPRRPLSTASATTSLGHRCCGAGRGFRAVHRPPVLPGEGCNGRDGVEARPCGRRRGASRGGATTTPTAASSPLSTFGRCRGGGLSCGLTGAGAHQRSDLVPIGQIIQPPLLLYNFVDLSGIFSAVWNQHIYLRISRLWYQRGCFDDGPIKSIHVCSSIGKSCQQDGA